MATCNASERRSFVRVVYGPSQRPHLAVGNHSFEVADINQGGLRLILPGSTGVQNPVFGTVTFRDGFSVDILGRIEWHQGGQAGLSFDRLLPEKIIRKEQRYAILSQE